MEKLRVFRMEFNENTDCVNQAVVDKLKSALDEMGIEQVTTNEFFSILKQEPSYAKASQKEFMSLCYVKALAKKLEDGIKNNFNLKEPINIQVDEKTQDVFVGANFKKVESYSDIVKIIGNL